MKTTEVVAAIIENNGLYFATQRGYGDYKDSWEFPGGKIEDGESAEDALVREIKEELDADINVLDYFCTVEYDYPDFHLTMHCYLCELASEGFVLKEHEAAKWLAADELASLDWLAADLEIVELLQGEADEPESLGELEFPFNKELCHAIIVEELPAEPMVLVGEMDGYEIYQLHPMFFDPYGFLAIEVE